MTMTLRRCPARAEGVTSGTEAVTVRPRRAAVVLAVWAAADERPGAAFVGGADEGRTRCPGMVASGRRASPAGTWRRGAAGDAELAAQLEALGIRGRRARRLLQTSGGGDLRHRDGGPLSSRSWPRLSAARRD